MKTSSLSFYVILLPVFLMAIPLEGSKKKKNRLKNTITEVIQAAHDDKKETFVKKPRGCSICCAFKKIYEGSALVPTMLYYQLMLIVSEYYALPMDNPDYDSDVEIGHARARKVVIDAWERILH